MADNETPLDPVRSMMATNLERARDATTTYFQLLEKSMSTSPLGSNEQITTFRNYVERNVAASFAFSGKLLHAKDFPDVLRIQTEFLKKQFEEAKEISEAASTAFKARAP